MVKTVNEIEIYAALSTHKKVRDTDNFDLEKLCDAAICVAFFQTGNKLPDAKDLQMLIMELFNDCQKFYPGISCDEIKEAILRGSKGLYGEVYGINPKAWNEWIAAYLKQPTRIMALKIKPAPTEMSEDQIKQARINFINLLYSVYLNFINGLEISDHYAMPQIYDKLIESRLINPGFTPEIRQDALEWLTEQQSHIPTKERAVPDTEKWKAELYRNCQIIRVKAAFLKMKENKDFDLKTDLINKL